MSDDIVKYLRLSRTRFNRHAEAADEIERLRAELALLGSFLNPIEVTIHAKKGKNYDAEKIAELIAKAVRGE